ncbi:MAG TPA: hypothetical protein DDY04_05840, partial [Bacteroidales bacterium]|nr:hypothetical protein [Bacteroidales bacterium]
TPKQGVAFYICSLQLFYLIFAPFNIVDSYICILKMNFLDRNLTIALIFFILILAFTGNAFSETPFIQDTLKGKKIIVGERSSVSTPDKTTDTTKINQRNIFGFLDIDDPMVKSFAWFFDNQTYDLLITQAFDSSLYLVHLVLPGQKNLSTLTYLGNMGSPIQFDHFFERSDYYPFLFAKGYSPYEQPTISRKNYNVRRPHTLLEYSTSGKRSIAEQNFRVFHTQNVNQFLNIGLQYDYYNTKGIYENQLTRNNDFTAFASFYKKRISAQGTFAYTYIRNKENGGLLDDSYIQDTVMEPNLVPFKLKDASTEYRKRSFGGVVGYDILVKKSKENENDMKSILTAKLIFDANRYTRVYSDTETDSLYYNNFYISTTSTHDSTYMVTYQTTLLVELSQVAKFPGIPGLRAWFSILDGSYHYFTPDDFIYSNDNPKLNTNHFGVGAFSQSKYLSYSGAARFYLSGYRAADKEVFGRLAVLPWKSKEMPYIAGELSISDREPDIFVNSYFSNHYKWNSNFDKESRFRISAKFGAERVGFEAGYNLEHILNFVYFDTLSLPAQTSKVTVTSAYLQEKLKVGWFNAVCRVIWQASTNADVLSLPTFSGFSAVYIQFPVVKNVLTMQFGVSGSYRTNFFADAYNPALGIYYNQRNRKIGNYPFVDVFLNAKWKRTNLFVKLDHVNQGIPNNQYYTTFHYPHNPRRVMFGVSWMFYD